MFRTLRPYSRPAVALLLVAGVAMPLAAQEPATAPLAKSLAQLLEQQKLDSIAAQDPAKEDEFFAALYFPDTLLVVSAKFVAPVLLSEKIRQKEFRDVYIDLNSASVAGSRIMIEDLGADGIRSRRGEDQPFDTYETGGKRVAFDGNWKAQKLSEDEYMKLYGEASEKYTRMLTTLLSQARKTSD